MAALQAEKKRLRQIMREKRNALSAAEKSHLDAKRTERFLKSAIYQNCTALYSFLALPHEPDTWKIVRQALADGKCVFVPRCFPKHYMKFFRLMADISLEEQLVSGSFGVYEPNETCPIATLPPQDSVCLVPGLAFDCHGNRLGYGGGYYDRFLATNPQLLRLGFGMTFSLVESVPTEPTDCRLDGIITEDTLEVWHGKQFQP